MFICW